MAGLSGCNNPAGWQFVPKEAVIVVAANPEGIFLSNLRLDDCPVVPSGASRRLAAILSGPRAYTGVVYGYQLRQHKQEWFFIGNAGKTPQDAETLLLLLSNAAGNGSLAATSVPIPNTDLTLTALYHPDQKAATLRLLDSMSRTKPQQHSLVLALPRQVPGIAVAIPDVAWYFDIADDSSFAHGQLLFHADLVGKHSRAGFEFTPSSKNPLCGNPLLDTFSRLHPWERDESDTAATELTLRIRKTQILSRLRKDRRFKVFELMTSFVKIPATDLISSAGSDIYYRGEGQTPHGYSVTMSVSNPGRMKKTLTRMVEEGSLSGQGNRDLLGSKSAKLYTHGGLLTFQYKNGTYPQAFGRRDGVSLSMRANAASLKAMDGLLRANKTDSSMLNRTVLGLIRRLEIDVLNREDGSFSGNILVEHNLDLIKMADKI